MREEFYRDLLESGWIHKPLTLKKEASLEEERRKQQVVRRKPIWTGSGDGCFHSRGEGQCRIKEVKGQDCLEMRGKLRLGFWPQGMPQDGDCAYYGDLKAVLERSREDWRDYNRLSFLVYPNFEAMHTISLAAWVKNQGKEKVPDSYNRTGQHMLSLENRKWNHCIWEFSSMDRDCITELEFRYRLSGSDTGIGEEAVFYIKEIYLEKTEREEKHTGWDLEKDSICYDTCGYLPEEEKYALTDCAEGSFFAVDAESGEKILEGKIEPLYWKEIRFGKLDFSGLGEGWYRLYTDKGKSSVFQVGRDWLEEMLYKGLNFIFCQRCGYPVPGKHGCCHTDCYGEYRGMRIPYWGGWHDAGDMSQQTAQTAETCESLFLTAARVKENRPLYARLMEEACWGLSFLFRTRAGDGVRATSLGLIRWTDGIQGNQDDAGNVRVNRHALDNFICACAFAGASRVLKDYDPETGRAALAAAREDYGFAMEQYKKYGFELPVMWEHTYGSSQALCRAIISKCAAMLFLETGEECYKKDAAFWARELLKCQETQGKIKGFFYRDETHTHIQHFNHQAREQYFAQCLVLNCRIFKGEKEEEVFRQALEAYGSYLEFLMEKASPYGMMPSGLYREDEARHREIFQRMHLLVPYEACREDYVCQVRQGEKLEEGLFLRQFPVWFSFRGNTNVQLSMGDGALTAGRYLGKEKLIQASAEQIHWVNGRNPFRQSLMTGNGKRYGSLYGFFPGNCTGQLPVGIQTKKNEDTPFWPAGNQATHREVWTSCTIKMMDICGKLIEKYDKNDNDLF
ncbi:MAG TPA: glycoside hydrolase family 9 protein [Candidatus Blautia pullicola]|uniref:Glycoside hydrolase family 9 protein n=1 Tax=Candidatus Blautia pullicola TaxID=2838498 RepID=A0A9D2FPM1_9FIRM|nr:glycoside hydrolase family 9 protein [Candidatus Blautia pullicola]